MPLYGISYGNSEFVAAGEQSTILTSPDGATWTSRNPGAVLPLLGIAYGNGRFVAVGFVGTILTSGTVVTLALGPAPVWSANGMSLALDGPVGSNYVIQASSDLVNWTPIDSFSITNSPFYFHGAAATNSSARFYRAMLQ